MTKNRTIINNRWDKENMKRIVCKFTLKGDADILEKLSEQKNRTDYIRQLIRADIARHDNRPDDHD